MMAVLRSGIDQLIWTFYEELVKLKWHSTHDIIKQSMLID